MKNLHLLRDKVKTLADLQEALDGWIEAELGQDASSELMTLIAVAKDNGLTPTEFRIHWEEEGGNVHPKVVRKTCWREKAAAFFLCEDDIAGALEKLDDAESDAECDAALSEISIWEPFENETYETITSLIDDLERILREAYNVGKKEQR